MHAVVIVYQKTANRLEATLSKKYPINIGSNA